MNRRRFLAASGAALAAPFIIGRASAQVIRPGALTSRAFGGAFTGILDAYSVTDAWDVGHRLLTSYTGSLFRLRRSSDDAEQDIGYTATGAADTAAATSFLGGSNGFITKVYSQTGSTDLAQTTNANQPAYSATGFGGGPCASFNGTSHHLTADAIAGNYDGDDKPLTWITAAALTFNATRIVIDLAGGAGNIMFFANAASSTHYLEKRGNGDVKTSFLPTGGDTGDFVYTVLHTGVATSLFRKTTTILSEGACDQDVMTSTTFTIGALRQGAPANFHDGTWTGLIADPSQLADHAAINAAYSTLKGV